MGHLQYQNASFRCRGMSSNCACLTWLQSHQRFAPNAEFASTCCLSWQLSRQPKQWRGLGHRKVADSFKLTKMRMQNDAKRMQQPKDSKCITKLHKEYRIFKCLEGRIKMNQGSWLPGLFLRPGKNKVSAGCGGICIHFFFWRWLIWPIDIQNKPVWSCVQWFRNKFFIGWSRYVSSIWPAWLLSCAATMAGAGIFSSLVCTDHHPPLLRLI